MPPSARQPARFFFGFLGGTGKGGHYERGLFALSDPRNRNHKSLAIANRNFEVASFARRNSNEITVLQVFSESQ